MVVAFKALIYLIAFKALSTLFFWEPISVLAAALIAVVICAIEYFVYSEMTRRLLVDREPLLSTLAMAAGIILTSSFGAALVIAFAFSKEFWQRSLAQGWSSFSEFYEQYPVLFAIMIALPLLANMAFFVWAIRSRH